MLTPIGPNNQHKIPAAWMHERCFMFAKIENGEKLPCDFYGRVTNAHDPAKWLTPNELKSSPIFFNSLYSIALIVTQGVQGLLDKFCADLDHCFEKGVLVPEANAILSRFPGAYTEISQSGEGLHILGQGSLPKHRTRAAGLELYTRARFIYLTGTAAQGDAGINFTPALEQLVADFGLVMTAAEQAGTTALVPDMPRPGTTGICFDNATLIGRMIDSRGSAATAFGDKIHPRDLWYGNTEAIAAVWPQAGRKDGCPFDRTRAEGALIAALMFWTGGHESRVRELFAQSALYRPDVHPRHDRKIGRPIARMGMSMTRFYNQPPPGAAPALLPPPPATGAYDGDPYAAARANAQAALMGQVVPSTPIEFPPLIDAASAIQGPIEDVEWTVRDWLQHRAVNLLGGDGGGGKTTLAFQLGMAAAGMRTWLGKIVSPRRVLYVSGEDNGARMVRTAKRVAEKMGHDASNFFMLSLDGFLHRTLVNIDRNGGMVPTATLEHIARIVEQHLMTMVIFDPVANLWDGNEIDRAQVTTFLSIVRNRFADKLGCTVVINAHPSREGMRDGSGYSGSSAWNGSVKSRLYLAMDDENGDKRKLTLAKSNDAKPGQQILMTWQDGVFVVNEDDKVAQTDQEIDDVFMAILNRRMKLGMKVSSKPSPTYAPAVFERDEYAGGIRRREFERSMMRLKEAGMIDFIVEGPPSKERVHVVPTTLPTNSN